VEEEEADNLGKNTLSQCLNKGGKKGKTVPLQA
jgi:hypothetical protein